MKTASDREIDIRSELKNIYKRASAKNMVAPLGSVSPECESGDCAMKNESVGQEVLFFLIDL